VLAVEDGGPGLVPEHRQRVFEPFFTTKEEGTGLGLAISQRIAEAHGGTLTAEDGPQGGARFVLALPLFDQAEPAPGRSRLRRPGLTERTGPHCAPGEKADGQDHDR
ncbi:MAG TPA: HAMP domain-containing sensor histidine kinase, partial [Deferrisomatales bacterium]|nr:HAMP domain-containing sensor histidine kinase [Deferrisomatales bacterium]